MGLAQAKHWFANASSPATSDQSRWTSLYALRMQATIGDVRGPRPRYDPYDPVGAALWDAWKECEGLSRDLALHEYSLAIRALSPCELGGESESARVNAATMTDSLGPTHGIYVTGATKRPRCSAAYCELAGALKCDPRHPNGEALWFCSRQCESSVATKSSHEAHAEQGLDCSIMARKRMALAQVSIDELEAIMEQTILEESDEDFAIVEQELNDRFNKTFGIDPGRLPGECAPQESLELDPISAEVQVVRSSELDASELRSRHCSYSEPARRDAETPS